MLINLCSPFDFISILAPKIYGMLLGLARFSNLILRTFASHAIPLSTHPYGTQISTISTRRVSSSDSFCGRIVALD